MQIGRCVRDRILPLAMVVTGILLCRCGPLGAGSDDADSEDGGRDSGCVEGTFSCARRIDIDSSTTRSIAADGDVHYYVLTVPGPGVLDVTVTPTPGSDLRLRLQLFDADQAQLEDAYAPRADEVAALSYLIRPGDYFLRVSAACCDAGSSTLPYTLEVRLDTSDVHETNNRFTEAASISTGSDVEAKIRPDGDEDYYSVTVATAGVLDVTVTPSPGSDLRLRLQLFDADQAQLEDAYAPRADEVAALSYLIRPGDYFLRVSAACCDAGSSKLPYTLEVRLDTSDVHETNNRFAEAASISTGSDVEARIRPDGDEDYYSVTVATAGVLDVTVTPTPGSDLRLRLQLFDADQAQLEDAYAPRADEVAALSYSVSPGDYFLRVSAACCDATSSTSPYMLHATLE